MSNLTLIKGYHQSVWRDKNLAAIEHFVANNIVIHSPLETTQGVTALMTILKKWWQAFPSLTVQWDDYISEHDKIVSRWSAQGVHEGDFLGLRATHQSVNYTGVSIYRLQDDKIIEYWAFLDTHAILQQLSTDITLA